MKLVPGMGPNGPVAVVPTPEASTSRPLGKAQRFDSSMFLAAVRTTALAERHADGATHSPLSASAGAQTPNHAAAESAGSAVQGLRRERPPSPSESSSRIVPQRSEIRGEVASRRLDDGIASALPVGIDWPWLAIATGGLSHRPSPASFVAAASMSTMGAGADQARPGAIATAAARLDHAAGTDARMSMHFESSFTSASAAGARPAPAAQDDASAQGETVDPSNWLWPAEVRELIERRRLQIVDEGGGSVRLLVRDFHVTAAEIDRWAESIHREMQAAGQSIRVLWINGRHYDFPQGEPHDR